MAYLIPSDYLKLIQSDNLNQITGNNPNLVSICELTAVEEAKSYLIQKFDVDFEFQPITVWDSANTYNAGNRVYLDAPLFSTTSTYTLNQSVVYNSGFYIANKNITTPGAFNPTQWTFIGPQYSIYYAIYPNPQFIYNGQYMVGDIVFWNDKIYTCQIATASLSQQTELQFRAYQNIPPLNVAPDNLNNGFIFWGNGTSYNVPANTLINNSQYWLQYDNRSQQMVTVVIDICLYHLHSRISPRNIPDLRVKRYDDAKDWLMKCSKGDITPNLKLLEPNQGLRIRYGGNIKNINSY
jgi:hypothetical protein